MGNGVLDLTFGRERGIFGLMKLQVPDATDEEVVAMWRAHALGMVEKGASVSELIEFLREKGLSEEMASREGNRIWMEGQREVDRRSLPRLCVGWFCLIAGLGGVVILWTLGGHLFSPGYECLWAFFLAAFGAAVIWGDDLRG